MAPSVQQSSTHLPLPAFVCVYYFKLKLYSCDEVHKNFPLFGVVQEISLLGIILLYSTPYRHKINIQ